MDELREKTGLDKSKLNKRMAFWCSRGILKQGPLENATSETWALNDTTADFERFSKQVRSSAYYQLNICCLFQQLQANVEENLSDEEEEEDVPIDVQVESLEQYWAYTKNLVRV